jgi:glycosidase
MIDAMKYWVINADIDGYRCDAADFVPYDFWQQANTSLNAIPGKKLIMLAEGSRSDHFSAGFQMNFSWDYLTTLKSVFSSSGNASTLFTTNTSEYAVVPSGKRKLRFTTNHDESNISVPSTVFKSKSGALAASVISIYLQGVPLLYCGQEVGVSSTAIYNGSNTIDWNANPDMLSEYKNLLTFYNASATARKGTLQTYNDTNISVFQKSLGTENVLVLVNTRSGSQSFMVPSSIQGIWTNALTNNPLTLSNTIALNGYGYLVLKK